MFSNGVNGRAQMGVRKPGKPKNTKQTLARLFYYLKPYTFQMILVTVFVMLAAISNIAGSYLLKPIIDNAIIKGDLGLLKQYLLIMGLIYFVGASSLMAYQRIMVDVSSGVLYNIRLSAFDKMQTLPISYFDKRTHGEIMSLYSNDIDTMREMLARSIPQLIQSLTTIIGFLVAMILLNWFLIIICIVQVIVNVFIIGGIGKRSKNNYVAQQRSMGEINGNIEEAIEGQKVIKVFNHEQKAKQDFDEFNLKLCASSTRANTYANILMPIMGNTAHIFYAIIVVVGALMIFYSANGVFTLAGLSIAVSVGSLVTFLDYSRRFSMPITNLSQQFNSIFNALAGAERVFIMLDQPSEIDDGQVTLVNASIVDGKLTESSIHTGLWAWKNIVDNQPTYVKLQGDIDFKNLTFSYESDKVVLKNISLYAKRGQKIAFVGSTGAGKTTITNLINRFYDVDDGNITYDGIDINNIKKADLRRSLAMVLQDTHLFTGTVMDNIRYGNLSSTDEQCINAAKLANADFFISCLPNKYQTMLTADGANLSQGQRQLLAIARAAVADPPVLILDEATSSIDTRTEKLIEKGMDGLMKGRTVFVIAHRLSTVRNSKAILVLEKGEIIERGNHDSLLSAKGKYYELYNGMLELD
ncbi:MAG: ABC transporter ATP-binding protein [Clostridia bacterium]